VTQSSVPAAAGAPEDRAEEPRRRRFLAALSELDMAWFTAFDQTGFGDIYFSRLFTELWLRPEGALAKTDAYSLVKGFGTQTAMKYVRRAIDEGYLEELENPADGRSRLLRMTPLLRTRMEQFIDRGHAAFSQLFLSHNKEAK
jgi:hypothetical protein